MSSLEAYILKKYSRWVPFTDCSSELLFDIEECLDASITKECSACSQTKVSRGNKDSPIGGILTPKLFPIEYVTKQYAIPFEHIDIKSGGLLYSALARLIELNMHIDQKEEE